MTDSRLDRRSFIKIAGGTTGTFFLGGSLESPPWLVSRAPAVKAAPARRDVFAHGIACGDPTASSAVIWTRVTPRAGASPGSGEGPRLAVGWEVAEDERFRRVVARDSVVTGAPRDHTVKVDVTGLAAGREYFYRFKAKDEISQAGRIVTAPSDSSGVRFGVASCSNFEGGFFSAYRHLSERDDLDLVLHLGDYIYEYGPGDYGPGPAIGRTHEPDHEIVSLADYRIRYGQYRSDQDLQGCHASHPFVCIWDDHEVTNDTWAEGAENHQPDTEGGFLERRARAYQAYFEWMPVRLPRPRREPHRIYRTLRFGNLADLHLLDTRQYRSEQPSNQLDPSKDDPERTLLGEAQKRWLKDRLERSDARWKLIGNQVMVTPWETGEGVPFNVDSWDGYRAERSEILDHLSEKAIDNVVFLTGDIHTSWATDVPLDSTTYPLAPSVAVELVGSSISSDNADEITGSPPRTTSLALEEGIKADNPYVKYVELDSHGYSVVDVTENRLQMDWFYISDRIDPDASLRRGASWQVIAGSNQTSPADGPIR